MFKQLTIIILSTISLLLIYSGLEQRYAFADSDNLYYVSDTSIDKPAEQEYKNIRVLKGMPASKVHIVMRFMANSLGVKCDYCHVTIDKGPWPLEKDDKPTKLKAREMITMMNRINQDNFEGKQEVNCATCHNGNPKPQSVPPLFHEPTEVAVNKDSLPDVSTILDKYVNAIGGKSAFEKITTRITKGEITLRNGQKQQVEISQSAPDKIIYSITAKDGLTLRGYNGKTGWMKNPYWQGELDEDDITAIKNEGLFNKEINLNKYYSNLKVRGITIIDNHKAYQVTGTVDESNFIRLYFDIESGMLLRSNFYRRNPFGLLQDEFTYDDYRDINGAKMPFTITERSANYTQVFKISEIKLNTPIEDQTYNMPLEEHKN